MCNVRMVEWLIGQGLTVLCENEQPYVLLGWVFSHRLDDDLRRHDTSDAFVVQVLLEAGAEALMRGRGVHGQKFHEWDGAGLAMPPRFSTKFDGSTMSYAISQQCSVEAAVVLYENDLQKIGADETNSRRWQRIAFETGLLYQNYDVSNHFLDILDKWNTTSRNVRVWYEYLALAVHNDNIPLASTLLSRLQVMMSPADYGLISESPDDSEASDEAELYWECWRPQSLPRISCDSCGQRNLQVHYHCDICRDGNLDLCLDCIDNTISCEEEGHSLDKRNYSPPMLYD